jgi:Dolichyl-phosphate-mannose-protein mannosyltransferase
VPLTGSWVASPTAERIALALLLVAALGLRVVNLGKLGLIADEGHQAMAVAGILEHWVPVVPSGNIYFRGGPFLYAEAAAAALDRVSEFTLRLPAALFGVLCVWFTFLYGRLLFGRRVGWIAAVLTAFSLWELEMSRYARMYTLLQWSFLGTAIFFYSGYVRGVRGHRPLAWAFAALAAVVHHLGLFALLALAVPLILPASVLPPDLRGRGKLRFLVPAVLMGVLWVAFHGLEGRLMVRAQERVSGPAEVAAGGTSFADPVLGIVRENFLVPPFLLAIERLHADRVAIAGALALTLAFAWPSLVQLFAPARRWRALWGLAILGASFLNLFAVAIGLAAAYPVVFAGAREDLRRRPLAAALAGSAALLVFWILFLLAHPEARDPGWGGPRSIGTVLFGYPPFKSRVLDWFLTGWRIMTWIVLPTLFILLARFVADRRRAPSLYAPALVILPLLAMTATREVYNESRYHFHVYPFTLTIFAIAVDALVRGAGAVLEVLGAILGSAARLPGALRVRRWGSAAATVLVLLAASPDIAPGSLAQLIGRDYSTPIDPVRAILSWRPYSTFHQDHEGPAKWVKAELQPEDRVIVLGPTYWVSIYFFYLDGRVDYAVSGKGDEEDARGLGPVRHHITGVRCLVTPEEIEQVLAAEAGHRLWIFGDLNLLAPRSRHFSPPMKQHLIELCRPIVYLGRDRNTFVSRHEPALARAPARATARATRPSAVVAQ